MKKFITKLVREEDGATVVEYGVLLALIIAVCIVVIAFLGNKVSNAFNNTAAQINQ